MHPAVAKSLEEIDAAVFSGDMLYVTRDRAELQRYVGRWVRALKESEEGTEDGGAT